MKRVYNPWLLGVAGILALLLVWQVISMVIPNTRALPPPAVILSSFLRAIREPIGPMTLQGHIMMSLFRVVIGYVLAAVLGVVLGLVMAWSKSANAIVRPLFELLRPIPPLAWIPMAIIWFGIGEATKYTIIFIATFPTIVINTYSGASRADPVLVGAGQMLGASKSQIFTTVVLPASVPQIFAGLQVALSSGWMAVLAAEMIRSSDGAGWVIIRGMEVGDTTQILVGMIAIGIVGFLLATIMRLAERRCCAWNIQGA